MPRPRFTSETGRAAGQKSGNARRIRSVPLELPDFVDPPTVQAALEKLAKAGAAGTLHGGQLSAVTKAVEVWLKVEAHQTDLVRMKALERQIAELEAALAAARREPWRDA